LLLFASHSYPHLSHPFPFISWFHGKLDRLTAEKRLLTAGKAGCYLVRESDRRSNTYVLSYLGVQGINHFKIAAICGEFFIGGRKFDSLSHLVGFYTSCSDLLQNGRLVHPVVPAEPVKDNKKVIALHPYTKVADSDELSFIRGDILVVQNDLSQYAEGWLWCSNLRTFESGLVFKDLVVEIDDEELDTNELFPWYHSSISKEEAVDKLAKMGPGSFLVRKSERSPGNFSLFFHINNTVQRFRIERLGDRYIMGGRTFDSLDAVIKRYQHEQIVEGYCLGDPVLRAPIQLTIPTILRKGFAAVVSASAANSSPAVTCSASSLITTTTTSESSPNSAASAGSGTGGEDVYATLRESRENAKKNQSVWMRGYLFKRSE
jgi:Ras GTPase-activating protein 1